MSESAFVSVTDADGRVFSFRRSQIAAVSRANRPNGRTSLFVYLRGIEEAWEISQEDSQYAAQAEERPTRA
jgi:hypothetical protein